MFKINSKLLLNIISIVELILILSINIDKSDYYNVINKNIINKTDSKYDYRFIVNIEDIKTHEKLSVPVLKEEYEFYEINKIYSFSLDEIDKNTTYANLAIIFLIILVCVTLSVIFI